MTRRRREHALPRRLLEQVRSCCPDVRPGLDLLAGLALGQLAEHVDVLAARERLGRAKRVERDGLDRVLRALKFVQELDVLRGEAVDERTADRRALSAVERGSSGSVDENIGRGPRRWRGRAS